MMALAFFVAMLLPPVLAGAGQVSLFWVGLSMVAAYVWGVWAGSGYGAVNPNRLRGEDKRLVLREIQGIQIMLFAMVGVVYLIARLFRP